MVVDALPMRLFSSLSRLRELVMVEPRYTNSFTTSSSYSAILMLGAVYTHCPMTWVFFWLMVRPNSWHALLKQSISLYRSSFECVAMAASSANRMSRRHLVWTFLLALSLARLKSFPSDLVRRYTPSVDVPKA